MSNEHHLTAQALHRLAGLRPVRDLPVDDGAKRVAEAVALTARDFGEAWERAATRLLDLAEPGEREVLRERIDAARRLRSVPNVKHPGTCPGCGWVGHWDPMDWRCGGCHRTQFGSEVLLGIPDAKFAEWALGLDAPQGITLSIVDAADDVVACAECDSPLDSAGDCPRALGFRQPIVDDDCQTGGPGLTFDDVVARYPGAARKAFDTLIADAVAKEREACAVEAERAVVEYASLDVLGAVPERDRIARRIRARGTVL